MFRIWIACLLALDLAQAGYAQAPPPFGESNVPLQSSTRRVADQPIGPDAPLREVVPRGLPPVHRPSAAAASARLNIKGYKYCGYGFFLTVNQSHLDTGAKRYLEWSNGRLPSGVVWEEVVPVGEMRVVEVKAVEKDEGFRFFQPERFNVVGGMRVTVRNVGGWLKTEWTPLESTQLVPIFNGVRTDPTLVFPNMRRIRMANDGARYEAFVEVEGGLPIAHGYMPYDEWLRDRRERGIPDGPEVPKRPIKPGSNAARIIQKRDDRSPEDVRLDEERLRRRREQIEQLRKR
jgi:hypothetical protein